MTKAPRTITARTHRVFVREGGLIKRHRMSTDPNPNPSQFGHSRTWRRNGQPTLNFIDYIHTKDKILRRTTPHWVQQCLLDSKIKDALRNDGFVGGQILQAHQDWNRPRPIAPSLRNNNVIASTTMHCLATDTRPVWTGNPEARSV